MFKRNTGKQYEELIKYVYEQLSYYNGKNIKVERNIKLRGKSNCEHQIDVYYEFEMNGVKHKVMIECKDHKESVEKRLVEAFKGKLDDIGGCTGIFASRNGFQKGAIEFAKFYDIELVSGGEFPLINKVLAKKIEVVLPDTSVVGEPFWTIMEEQDGQVTGTYMCVGDNTLGLFVSKKIAMEISTKTGGVVRGISQKHLRIIIEYGRKYGLKLCLFLLDPKQGIIIEPKAVEDFFIV